MLVFDTLAGDCKRQEIIERKLTALVRRVRGYHYDKGSRIAALRITCKTDGVRRIDLAQTGVSFHEICRTIIARTL